MKLLTVALLVLLGAIQYPLWLGKGGWLRVAEVDQQIHAQRETNARLKARNAALDAEVRDLKQGMEAIEERARSELDGAAMSAEVLAALQLRVKSLAARGVQPGLATVLVGDNAASRAYVRNKLRTCAETGLHAEL